MCDDVDKLKCRTDNLWFDLHHSWAGYTTDRSADNTRSAPRCHRVVSQDCHFSVSFIFRYYHHHKILNCNYFFPSSSLMSVISLCLLALSMFVGLL